MERPAEYVQVSTATPSRELATKIADALIERQLASCVQIAGPIASTYWWRGAVERSEEWLCLIKTSGDRFEAVASAIRELHPYETPEIIATAIVAGDATYLRWIADSTQSR